MKLKDLETKLVEKDFDVKFVKVDTDKVKQERIYLNLDKAFSTYFIDFEGKPFLYVYISRQKGFDYSTIKTFSEEVLNEENSKCRSAKLKILNILKQEGIEGVEFYENESDVPLKPASKKKKIELW